MVQPKNVKLNYLPDLDGLRAVAVLGVVAFHLGMKDAPGGFTGVDIFFVISGYIITRMIASQVNDNNFRFGQFYIRRARRLIPALIVVTIVTLAASFFILSPDHFKNASQSAIYSTLSVSNFLFWLQSGYFDPGKFTKPLLHTWSLGVEEQFYLVWPLAIFVLLRLTRTLSMFRYLLIFIAGALSFTGMLLVQKHDAGAAFYLSPFRMWQFCAGGLLAFIHPALQPSKRSSRLLIGQSLAFICGLFAVGYSFYCVSSNGYPGLSSLIPTAGAAALLLSLGSPLSRNILGFWPIAFIGRISYSVYLVHWPLIVLYMYPRARLSPIEMAYLAAVTFLLATCLYFLVERPLRSPWRHDASNETTTVIAALSSLAFAISVFSAHVWAQGGWDWRLSKDVQERVKFMRRANTNYNCRNLNVDWSNAACQFGDNTKTPSRLIIGDSHAGRLAAGIYEATKRTDDDTGLLVKKLGGLPFTGAVTYVDGDPRKERDGVDQEIDYAATWQGDLVILHGFFEYYWWGNTSYPGYPTRLVGTRQEAPKSIQESQEYFRNSAQETFKRLSKSTASVVVVGSVPNSGINMRECMQRPSFFLTFEQMLESCQGITRDETVARTKAVNSILRTEAEAAGLIFVDPLDVFCPAESDECERIWNESFIYDDDNHLSLVGSFLLARFVLQNVR